MKDRQFERPRVRAVAAAALLFLLAALLLAGCSSQPALSAYLETHKNDLNRPAATGDQAGQPVPFVVEPGMTTRAIGQKLQAQGLIRDATLFEAYVRLNGMASRLQAGTFELNAGMTVTQIADTLQHAQAASITVRIPEGWRLEQIADYLGRAGVVDAAEYRELAQGALPEDVASNFGFLETRPQGASLEGYLFPDTYELPREGATALDLMRKQLENFQEKVVPVYEDAAGQSKTKLSLYQALTLASIVEREAAVDDERPVIAGVYLNRLAQGMRLEADPTVQYAMGYQAATGQWWKTPVSLDEYGAVQSAYNTYLHEGLPPGPIAEPGLASIKAVLAPAQHDYLFFVALPDGSGRHAFAATFEEHQKNVQKYLEGK